MVKLERPSSEKELEVETRRGVLRAARYLSYFLIGLTYYFFLLPFFQLAQCNGLLAFAFMVIILPFLPAFPIVYWAWIGKFPWGFIFALGASTLCKVLIDNLQAQLSVAEEQLNLEKEKGLAGLYNGPQVFKRVKKTYRSWR